MSKFHLPEKTGFDCQEWFLFLFHLCSHTAIGVNTCFDLFVDEAMMTARGVEFLNEWVSENVPPLPVTGDVSIRAVAQKLKDDAGAVGFKIPDLEIDGPQVEQLIRETLVHVAEPGTPGD